MQKKELKNERNKKRQNWIARYCFFFNSVWAIKSQERQSLLMLKNLKLRQEHKLIFPLIVPVE